MQITVRPNFCAPSARPHHRVSALLLLVGLFGLPAAQAALPPERSAQIDQLLQRAVSDGRLASVSVQVRQHGEVLYSGRAGYADLELAVPASAEDLYPIGSITKSMTAYCLFTLIGEGKLKLSDRLSDVLSDYRGAGREATILQLLTHTSGIHDYAGDSAPDLIGDPTRLLSEAQVVALFSGLPPDFAPGEHWRYSNSAYFLLGLVIEKLTGQRYEDVVQARLFQPFALQHILMDYRQPLMAHRVRGYTHDAAGHFENAPAYDASIALAAGGYRASLGDLTRNVETLFGAGVAPALRDLALRPVMLNDGAEISYRPAALVASDLQGHPVYSHAGGIWGAHAFIAYLPADQLAMGLATNTDDGTVDLGDLQRQIARIVLALPAPAIRDLPLAPRDGRAAAGVYCLREFDGADNRVTVSFDGQELSLTRSGDAQATRLRHQGQSRFVSAGDADTNVQFTADRAGTTIRIEHSPRGTLSGARCAP